MKLLLQRTLGDPFDGPFWLESAHLDQKLHAFMRLTEDPHNCLQARFAPDGQPCWVSDHEGEPQLYRPEPGLACFSFAFNAQGQPVAPPFPAFIQRIPDTDQYLVSDSEQLFRGPLDKLQPIGPALQAFSLDPQGNIWHTRQADLYRNEELIHQAKGSLDWPLWTPAGVLVTQHNRHKCRLLLVQEQATVLWQGQGEWLRAADYR